MIKYYLNFKEANKLANYFLDNYRNLIKFIFFIASILFILAAYLKVLMMGYTAIFVMFFIAMLFSVQKLSIFICSLFFTPILITAFIVLFLGLPLDDIFLIPIWIFLWISVSLVVNFDVAKIGNEIISKSFRVIIILLGIWLYFTQIQNGEYEYLRYAIISVTIYAIPSFITLIILDLVGYYEKNIKDKEENKFSISALKKEILEAKYKMINFLNKFT